MVTRQRDTTVDVSNVALPLMSNISDERQLVFSHSVRKFFKSEVNCSPSNEMFSGHMPRYALNVKLGARVRIQKVTQRLASSAVTRNGDHEGTLNLGEFQEP